ncbi:MAG TPA: hypothetical protein VH639_03515 [Bryobacteraceae bacterium]|jgi:hypothetical protein
MKHAIVAGIVLLAALGRADEAADRPAIDRTIESLNGANNEAAIRELATAEAYDDLNRLFSLNGRPWSETSRPHYTVRRIRFITPDVALLDATAAQYGSTILVRRLRILFAMRREEGKWRIASARVLADAEP